MTALLPLGRGPTDLREALAAFLSVRIPELIDLAVADWNIDPLTLLAPKEYNAYDPNQAKEYPAIGYIISNDSKHARVDMLGGGQLEYRVTYQVRTYVIARTPLNEDGTLMRDMTDNVSPPGRKEAMKMRDDLVTLVQLAYKGTPTCGDSRVKFREESLTTDHMEPFMPGTQTPGKWLAGSILTADFEFTMYSAPASVGTPDLPFELTIETQAL